MRASRLGTPKQCYLSDMLRILGKSTSINVRKVLWTCTELDQQYQLEQWGSGFRDTRDPAFLTLNPNALVPVIIDDDFVLWESGSICRYLASTRNRTDLLPVSARARARIEQWMDWQATELNSAWRYAFMSLVRKSPSHSDPAALGLSILEWNRNMTLLDRQLGQSGAFVTGRDFTLADILIGLSVHRWLSTPMQRPTLTQVEAYYERLSQRPGFMLHGRNGVP
jgi:glutathione S-transferase